MPKTKNKSVLKNQGPKTPKTTDRKENRPKPVKNTKTIKKRCAEDSIAMSKQLSIKKKIRENTKRASSRNNVVRICPNGKPIPSLADLERMFEDSDDDSPAAEDAPRDSAVTPKPEASTSEESKLLSPTTINKISQRMMEMISNISDPAELLNEVTPPPPVVPPKKRKKPEEPYIVGCKDRPQVIKKPKANFCKGDEDYGVEKGEPEDDSPPQKRAKKSKIPKYSKSIFNAKTDEIAEHLKQYDDGNESSDSNKTVNYEYMNSSLLQNSRLPSFSPLPSTSSDNATFFKNDQLFNESLKDQDNVDTQSEPEIIDTPCETIVIKDEAEQALLPKSVKNTYKETDHNCIEIIDLQPVPNNLEPTEPETQDKFNHNIEERTNDDDCVIIEPEPVPETTFTEPQEMPIVNEYHDISLIPPTEVIDDEVIDVDALIAQNHSILEKFKTLRPMHSNSVTVVADVEAPTANPMTLVRNNDNEINENVETPALNVEAIAPTRQEEQPQREMQNNSNEVSSSRSQVNYNEIEELVTNFFINRQNNIEIANRVEPEIEIIDVDDETRVKAVVCTTMDTKCKRRDLESVQSYLNSLINNFTPGNILKEFSPGKRQAQMASNDLEAIIPRGQSTHRSHDNSRHSHIVNADERDPIACLTTTVDVRRYPLHITKKNQIGDIKMDTPEPALGGIKNFGDCPICMEDLDGNAIASTICGHVFCMKCIKAAVMVNGKRCPTCRKPLRGKNSFHQLYL